MIPIDPDAGDARSVSRPAPISDDPPADAADDARSDHDRPRDASDDGSTDDTIPDLPRLAYPRLLRPMTAARVTSQRPTLRFVTAMQGDATRVEICRDRECTQVIEALDVPGHSARPNSPLPRGVYFWRATALQGGVPMGNASATWEFFVPPSETGTDTSWGISPDYNGDGYADVATSSTDTSTRVTTWLVYDGGPMGVGATPTQRIPMDGFVLFQPFLARTDFNGDGYVDTGAISTSDSSPGIFQWILGGANGLDPATGDDLRALTDPTLTAERPVPVFGADVDNDGYGDLGMVVFDINARRMHLEIHKGSPIGLAREVAYMLEARSDAGSNLELSTPQDVDADGRPDLLITSLPLDASESHFSDARNALYRGPGLTMFDRWLSCQKCVSNNGETARVTPAGDIDGDGYADALAQRTGSGSRIYEGMFQLLPGGPGGLREDGPRYMFGPSAAIDRPLPLLTPGDLDGNGTTDVIAVESDGAHQQLFIHQCLSISECGGRTRSVTTGLLEHSDRALQIYGVNDVNGDGFDDLYVRSTRQLFYGSPTGLDASRAVPIDPTMP